MTGAHFSQSKRAAPPAISACSAPATWAGSYDSAGRPVKVALGWVTTTRTYAPYERAAVREAVRLRSTRSPP